MILLVDNYDSFSYKPLSTHWRDRAEYQGHPQR